MRTSILPLLFLPALAGVANAAESAWFETDGVRLQLVTDDRPDADGQLRGVLKVALQPGWKTYWMDPGDAGVPPQIDPGASPNVTGATIHFPTPKRFDDGPTHWAGYGQPVDLPVTFTVADASKFTAIDASVFIGVCREVCIPVQAVLSATPDPQAAATREGAAIAAAFSRLPGLPTADFGVARFELSGDTIVARPAVPAGTAAADLFVVAPSGWLLGPPRADGAGGFDIHVAGRPAGGELPAALQYTLVGGDRAVTGSAALQ